MNKVTRRQAIATLAALAASPLLKYLPPPPAAYWVCFQLGEHGGREIAERREFHDLRKKDIVLLVSSDDSLEPRYGIVQFVDTDNEPCYDDDGELIDWDHDWEVNPTLTYEMINGDDVFRLLGCQPCHESYRQSREPNFSHAWRGGSRVYMILDKLIA